jgi:dTMP kinase
VSLEGGEGAGKSTQAKLLHDRLWDYGKQATLVHEPGTTPLGQYLRSYLLSKQPLSREAELLLFEAARAQLVNDAIRPSMAKGMTVIADRFDASTFAYQGFGRKIDLEVIDRLNTFATQGISPDVTFLLDIEPAEGLRRVGNPQLSLALEPMDYQGPGRLDVAGHRRFEEAPLTFHNRVRKGFLKLAQERPERWVIIDASQPEEITRAQIWRHVLERLDSPGQE